MLNDILTGNGLLGLPWWGYVLAALAMTHVTIACVTLFLHRSQAHLAVEFHPLVTHFMRFWLWLTTGMVTREWVAIHRKHHAVVETDEDPHSPRTHGILKVLFSGAELYRREAVNKATLETYGRGTPWDWVEENLYSKYPSRGIVALLVVDYALFGFWGISIWAVQAMWIPFFAAGVINGAGHFFGYRNYETGDDSTNLGNVGLLIGGEELHNNHHAFPASAKLSARAWEFDVGWLYINLLRGLGLARVKRVMPSHKAVRRAVQRVSHLDLETVQMLLNGRVHVMAEYVDTVMRPVFKQELKRARGSYQRLLKGVRKPFLHHEKNVAGSDHGHLKRAMKDNEALKTVYEFRHRLQSLWHDLRGDHEKLRIELLEWCRQAEQSGLHVLEKFARRIRGDIHAEQAAA